MEKEIKQTWLQRHLFDLVSYGGLVFCLIIFSILSDGKLWSAYNVGVLVQSTCVYVILAMGAVFVYSMGYMDISVGAQIGVYCILIILVTNSTHSLLAGFLVILGVSLLCSLVNGAVSVFLGLPSIVTSIFLSFIFSGIQALYMEKTGTNSISMERDMSMLKQTPVMLAAIILTAVISILLYNYTRLGKYVKGIGANERAVVQMGADTTRWKALAYCFFGVCVAVGALFLTARTGSAGKGTGSGYAMDIMVALILGGMPLSGGMKSKISSSLVGSFTYIVLSNGLTLSGVKTAHVYVIKALVFLVVILITSRKREAGVIPR